MRMVRLEFYDWRWGAWGQIAKKEIKIDRDPDEGCAGVFYVTAQEWIE